MRIAIFGAGSVGCYVGGRLAAAGANVVLVGRARLRREMAMGLILSDYRGARISMQMPLFAEHADEVRGADLVLVCVKSAATEQAGADLRPYLRPETLVMSLQNGLGNAATLARALDHPVLPAMVGFNVAMLESGHFHQGTQGDLHCQRDPRLPLELFARAGLPLTLHDDMVPVLWAKLMLNLNNPINALSNLPLRTQLSQRAYRLCLALAQQEFLSLCAQTGQALARLSPLPAPWIPRVLRLRDPLFRLIAGNMLRIDPAARSSMADDLSLGRPPEIDWLNGEVVRLAQSLGRDAPVNRRLCELVQEEATGPRRAWTGARLLSALQSAART